MVDAAHEKETRARETVQSLKLEIANLSKLVEQGAGLTMGQEHRYYSYKCKREMSMNFKITPRNFKEMHIVDQCHTLLFTVNQLYLAGIKFGVWPKWTYLAHFNLAFWRQTKT